MLNQSGKYSIQIEMVIEMRYKRLCLYKEKNYQNINHNHSSIESNKNFLDEDLTIEVLNYLKSGLELVVFVSPWNDPYDKNTSYPYGIYTDGLYIWDSTIIHWVEKYQIRLPKEFISHIHGNSIKNISNTELILSVDEIKNAEEIWL